MAYRVGIDIGSTATKACVLDGGDIAYTLVIPTGYSSVDAGNRVLEDLETHGYPHAECCYVATGYGRVAVPFAEKTITEITCHGKGAARLFGNDCVVVDIGGQDTKSIVLRNGKVADFRMNDKCSAGTGKFLEIMANRLGLTQAQLTDLAKDGKPTSISSMCTVFAESEVISLIGQGTPREDICRGIVDSVVKKVAPLVPKSPNNEYVLTGGLCENDYVVERLAKQLNGHVKTCPMARFAGALGAALSLPIDCAPTHTDAKPETETSAEASSARAERPKPNTVVFTFDTTTDSLAFEKICREAGLPERLAPLPSTISAGCGYAWVAPIASRQDIESAAQTADATYSNVYEVAL